MVNVGQMLKLGKGMNGHHKQALYVLLSYMSPYVN